ncbi:hypothetical protein T484DRAFT_1977231 [Baffinella frigidus]|nr:hypothetical protein T484DRAFT_1977231 [Cryptophyta sp. CCMP2293]
MAPEPVALKPTGLSQISLLISKIREERREGGGGAKSIGDEQPQWTRVREMLQRRTPSEAGERTPEEEEDAVWQRLRQAVLLTEFTGVVDNANTYLLRSAPPLGPQRSRQQEQLTRFLANDAVDDNPRRSRASFLSLGARSGHQGQIKRLQSRDGAVSAQSAHGFRPRLQRKRSTPTTSEAQDAAGQPRIRMWGEAFEKSGFSRASSV